MMPVLSPIAQPQRFPAGSALYQSRKHRYKIVHCITPAALYLGVCPVKNFLRNKRLMGIVRPYPFRFGNILELPDFEDNLLLAHDGMP